MSVLSAGDRIEWDRVNQATGDVVATEHGKVTGLLKWGPRIDWGWYVATSFWSDVERAMQDGTMRVRMQGTLL